MEIQKNNGITLIALIVTIIVLIILTGVSTNLLFDSSGIITSAEEGVTKYKNAEQAEIEQLVELENEINELTGIGLIADESGNGTVNTPKLTGDMKAVYWDDGGNEIDQDNPSFDVSKWYDYGTNTGTFGVNDESNRKAKWANAKTGDGSYWVWIPRYEYKIDSTGVGTDCTKAGIIDIRFIGTSKTTPTVGYTIHPAFTNNVNLGGWDSELTGFWVAKFEMSMETNGIATNPTDATMGNIAISSNVKTVSKPRSK